MRFRIRFAQQLVGFFLIATFLVLVVVLVLMGLNQRWFARNYTFYSRFSQADGLTSGMSIHLKGFEIGKVANVQLSNSNRVTVTLQVFEEYYDKIRPDSVIDLSVSPIGLGSDMKLLPGKNTLPPVEEFSFLPSTDTLLGTTLISQGLVDNPQTNGGINGIISQIEPLLIEVRGTATQVTKLLTNVNGAIEGNRDNQITTLLANVNRTLKNADTILSSVGNNTNTLLVSSQPLIKNIDSITGDIANLTSQMKDAKGLIPKLLDPKGSLASLLDDHNQLFDQIQQILTQVNSALGQVKSLATYLNQSTPQISGIMEDAKDTLKKTSDVMEGLSNNPLLKGGIPEKKQQTSTTDTLRDQEF